LWWLKSTIKSVRSSIPLDLFPSTAIVYWLSFLQMSRKIITWAWAAWHVLFTTVQYGYCIRHNITRRITNKSLSCWIQVVNFHVFSGRLELTQTWPTEHQHSHVSWLVKFVPKVQCAFCVWNLVWSLVFCVISLKLLINVTVASLRL
jgi:hypothetical protein